MTAPSDDTGQTENVASSALVRAGTLCVAYILVSACLIRFNKFLMTEDRFPFSLFLTACHMSVSFALCLLLYLVRPSAFPGMANCEGKKLLVAKWMMPIGVAFAISLFASNEAYIYSSVSFLQFMKEGNVIVCFLMSCAMGLTSMNRLRVAILVWIIAGSSFAVTGELHFVVLGFLYQLTSQISECSKAVMGEIVLGGGGLRLDPLSYTLFVAPTCLAVLVIGNAVAWDPRIPGALAEWWPYVVPNALLAFVLNILVASIIKEISAVGFILAGVCKDICIVLASCAMFGEVVTAHQIFGFALALMGVFFWSYYKVLPESTPVKVAQQLLMMEKEVPDEKTPLTQSVKV